MVLAGLGAAPAVGEEAVLDLRREVFSFANETVWSYQDGRLVGRTDRLDTPAGRRYTRRCFVLARAAVQFHKFARFQPGAARDEDAVTVAKLRAICARDAWRAPLPEEKRVVIPGYRDLREFSARQPELLQAHLGEGWPTYFRFGNFGIIFPPSRAAQERTAREAEELLRRGEPVVFWLVNFPAMDINHAVVAGRVREKKGRKIFEVYDPNLPGRTLVLAYDPRSRSFEFPKTFYFPGGRVDARVVYRSPLR
jgi:hypothetical protein